MALVALNAPYGSMHLEVGDQSWEFKNGMIGTEVDDTWVDFVCGNLRLNIPLHWRRKIDQSAASSAANGQTSGD